MPAKKSKKQKQNADEDESAPAVRGMWTGTISFGLVSVPVSLFPALRRRPVHLRWLSQDGTPLQRIYVCSSDGKTISRDELIRGYELEDGRMITIKDDELEALAPDKAHDITLTEFVDLNDIPDFMFDRPYFLAPAGGSSKAYQLLVHVMEEHQRAGIGTFVMRGKEYLVAIVAANGVMMAETLRFADEMRKTEQVPVPERGKPNNREFKKVERAFESVSHERIELDDLKDGYAKRLQQLIRKKKKNRKAVVHHDQNEQEDHAEETEGIVDLISIFKERMRLAEAED